MSSYKASASATAARQNRVPKGVRTGGRFAAGARSETGLVLGSSEGENSQLAEFIDATELTRISYDSASYWQNHYNQKGKSNTMDLDDLAQETILAVLERVDKGASITDRRQMINSIAANQTVRATSNKFRAEDRRAYRTFIEKKEALEGVLSRSLTQVEQDKVAQQVLDEWHDPRHKPSKDFRTPHTVDASLDRTFGEGDGVESTLGATLVNPENSGYYIEPNSFMDRAHTAMEETGAAHKAEMKRLGYNALAEDAGSPLALEASLSQRQVTKHRNTIKDLGGGIGEACRAWEMADDTEAVSAALFAPFGDLSTTDQQRVVDFLNKFSDTQKQGIWESAISFANTKHSKTN